MSIFENSFFSIEGQKERLSNVVSTLKAAVTGQGVQSNTGNKTADKVLSAAASNPFTTAGIAAVAINPAGAASAAKSAFNALPAGGKVAAVVAAPIVIGATVANPEIATKAAKAPSSLAQFGSNLGTFSKDPSIDSAKKVFNDNPLITSAAVVGTGVIIGKGTSSLIATAANTSAIRQNTESMVSGNVGNTSSISKYDVDAIEAQAKANKELAEIQLKSQREAQDYNLKLAQLQNNQQQQVLTNTSVPAAVVTTKKTTKKKSKSKKKPAPKKKKATKKKAPKKKKTTKKATKR